MPKARTLNLNDFDISPTTGFLPPPPLIRSNVSILSPWQELCDKMPKLLAAGAFRKAIGKLPLIEPPELGRRTDDLMMRMLSFIAHAYIWENWLKKPESVLPSNIAVPWHRVAKRVGRPPVLSYKSYALDNWALIDPDGPIELGNIRLIQNFLGRYSKPDGTGGIDEDWFILVHVDIEAKAGLATKAIGLAQEGVFKNDPRLVLESLVMIAMSLENMYKTLCRMRENCDPYVYYNFVRPYITGFARNPLVYEGVEEYKREPQEFFGETGAQSSIVPSLDAALGIEHAEDPLKHFVVKMMDYMPPKHREFIQAVAEGPAIKEYAESMADSFPELAVQYAECRRRLKLFRDEHLKLADDFVFKQGQASPHNPTNYGTGSTPFMPYLKKHRDET